MSEKPHTFFYGEYMPYVYFDKNGLAIKNGEGAKKEKSPHDQEIEKERNNFFKNNGNSTKEDPDAREIGENNNFPKQIINIRRFKPPNTAKKILDEQNKENENDEEEEIKPENEYNFQDNIPSEETRKKKQEIESEEGVNKGAEKLEMEARTVDEIEVERVLFHIKTVV
jgi:hypothetical protein